MPLQVTESILCRKSFWSPAPAFMIPILMNYLIFRFRCYGGGGYQHSAPHPQFANSKQPPHQQVIITISRLVSVAELSVYNYSGTILAQTLAITSAAVDARAPSLLISLFGGGVAGYHASSPRFAGARFFKVSSYNRRR